jgi:hypothetical protein
MPELHFSTVFLRHLGTSCIELCVKIFDHVIIEFCFEYVYTLIFKVDLVPFSLSLFQNALP